MLRPFIALIFSTGHGQNGAGGRRLYAGVFLGNFGMKSACVALIKRFGFRTILVVNGVMAGVAIMLLGTLSLIASEVVIAVMLFWRGYVARCNIHHLIPWRLLMCPMHSARRVLL